jgi:drug/metabolite transporter (DMT)-like permease
VASAPIFTFLLAFALEGEERAGRASLAGVGIGIVGVAVLLGVDTGGSSGALLGGLMVVLASLGYAIGSWYLKRNFAGAQPVGIVAATMTATSAMTAPFVAIAPPPPPADLPLETFASLGALGILGTGVAFVIFYSLIASEGPARASLVAYVAPGFSVFYGVTLLDEAFTLATAAGLLLIVGGSWLAAEGRLPWQRAAPAPEPLDPACGELAAGGVDVAPAGEAHSRA